MTAAFFERPILNSPYEYPSRHWELDKDGQPTQAIIQHRRRAEFITPIPKPKKRSAKQTELVLSDDDGLSSEQQQYHSAIINELRTHVDQWRKLPQNSWQVTPKPPAYCSTGDITTFKVYGRSSARSRLLKRRSG